SLHVGRLLVIVHHDPDPAVRLVVRGHLVEAGLRVLLALLVALPAREGREGERGGEGQRDPSDLLHRVSSLVGVAIVSSFTVQFAIRFASQQSGPVGRSSFVRSEWYDPAM